MAMVDHALKYAQLGYKVIPLCWPDAMGHCGCGRDHDDKNVGKAPLSMNGVKDATKDEKIIRDWWRYYPDANIGIGLDASKVMTISPDCEEYAEQFEANGLPTTMRWQSREHHWHAIYLTPKDCAIYRINKTQQYDIMAQGYVVAPPSLHQCGEVYELTTVEFPATMLPYAPQWAVDELNNAATKKKVVSTLIVSPNGHGHHYDEPPVRLDAEGLRWWSGELSKGDRSSDLMMIGMALARSRANRMTIIEALADRDQVLFDSPKYDDRPEEYDRIAQKSLDRYKESYRSELEMDEEMRSLPPCPPPATAPAITNNGHVPPITPTAKPINTPLPTHIESAMDGNEFGDAKLFAELCHGQIAYDHQEGEWYLWSGNAWRRDVNDQVKMIASNKLTSQYADHQSMLYKMKATHLANGEQDKADAINDRVSLVGKRIYALQSRKRIENVLAIAQTLFGAEEYGYIDGQIPWDEDAWLLGVQNGVVDLKTGDLRPGNPTDWIRIVAPTEWQGIDAPAPLWEKTLLEIHGGNTELVAFEQRLYGYGITGTSQERKFVLECGEGDNGKDLKSKLRGYVFGDYVGVVSTDVFIEKRGGNAGQATPHLVPLRGKRLVFAAETKKSQTLDSAQVKYITGNASISVRDVHEKQIVIKPTWTPVLATNHKPRVSDAGDAIWGRVIFMPHTQSFVADPDPNITTQHKYIPNLDELLHVEAPGILSWHVRGCLEYQKNGLNPPDTVKLAVKEYRDSENTIKQFAEDKLMPAPGEKIAARTMYNAYKAWCSDSHRSPESEKDFSKTMETIYEKKRDGTGTKYHGVIFADEFDDAVAVTP